MMPPKSMPLVTIKSNIPIEIKKESIRITEKLNQWCRCMTVPNNLILTTGKTWIRLVLILGNFFLTREVG